MKKKQYLCRTKEAAQSLFKHLQEQYPKVIGFPVDATWDFGRESTVYSVDEDGTIRFWVLDNKHVAEPEKYGIEIYKEVE